MSASKRSPRRSPRKSKGSPPPPPAPPSSGVPGAKSVLDTLVPAPPGSKRPEVALGVIVDSQQKGLLEKVVGAGLDESVTLFKFHNGARQYACYVGKLFGVISVIVEVAFEEFGPGAEMLWSEWGVRCVWAIGGVVVGENTSQCDVMVAPWISSAVVGDGGGFGDYCGRIGIPWALSGDFGAFQAGLGAGEWISSGAVVGARRLDFSAFINDKIAQFVGRADLTGRVDSWIKKEQQDKVLVVKGDPGLGKSAWLSWFVTNRSDLIAARHFCRYDDAKSLNSRRWLESLVRQILTWSGVRNKEACAAIKDQKAGIGAAWCGFLAALPRELPPTSPSAGKRGVIAIDSLDEAHDAGGREGDAILRALVAGRSCMPDWLAMIATSRKDESVMSVLQARLAAVTMEASSAENQADVRAWLEKYGGGLNAKTIDNVLQVAGGNFLYVRQLLAEGSVEDREDLPDGLRALYAARAHVVWKKPSEFEAVIPVLSVLVAALEPVPLDVLRTAAGSEVEPVLAVLSSVLERGGDGRVAVYHKSYVDWAVEDGVHGIRVDPEAGHAALAKAALSAPGWRENLYLLRHGLTHADLSENPGLKGKAVAEIGLKWDWMSRKAELDGWVSVANALEGKIGQVIRQWMGSGSQSVADGLALYGGDELGSEFVDVVAARAVPGQRSFDQTLLMRYQGHTRSTTCVVKLNDTQIVTGSVDGTCKVWDTLSGDCLMTGAGHTFGVQALAAFPDGRRFVCGDRSGSLKIWSSDGTLIAQIKPTHRMIRSVLVVFDQVLCCTEDRTITLWKASETDARAWHQSRALSGHQAWVYAAVDLGIIDGARRVATGSQDWTVLVWSMDGEKTELAGHMASVTALCRVDGGRLVSGATDGAMCVWNLSSFERETTARAARPLRIVALAGLDENRFAAADVEGLITVWSISGEVLGELSGHASMATSLCYLGENLLLSTGDDAQVLKWDVSPEKVQKATKKRGPSRGALLLTSGRVVNLAGGLREATLWESVDRGGGFVKEQEWPGLSGCATPNGGFALGTKDGRVVSYDGSGTEVSHFRTGGSPSIQRIASTSNGVLVTGTTGSLVRVLTSGTPSFDGHLEGVRFLLPVPGEMVVSIDGRGELKCLNIKDHSVKWTSRVNQHQVQSAVVVNDGASILALTSIGSLHLVNVADGEASEFSERVSSRLVIDSSMKDGLVLCHRPQGRAVLALDVATGKLAGTVVHVDDEVVAVIWDSKADRMIVVGALQGWIAYEGVNVK